MCSLAHRPALSEAERRPIPFVSPRPLPLLPMGSSRDACASTLGSLVPHSIAELTNGVGSPLA